MSPFPNFPHILLGGDFIFLVAVSCNLCHSIEIEMILAKEGPLLYCTECAFIRCAEAKDLFQDFLICA